MSDVTVLPVQSTDEPTGPRATLIGVHAARALRSGYRGRVIAAGTRAAYLRGDDGDILWLAAPDTPPHRRAVVTSDRPGLRPTGQPAPPLKGRGASSTGTSAKQRASPCWNVARVAPLSPSSSPPLPLGPPRGPSTARGDPADLQTGTGGRSAPRLHAGMPVSVTDGKLNIGDDACMELAGAQVWAPARAEAADAAPTAVVLGRLVPFAGVRERRLAGDCDQLGMAAGAIAAACWAGDIDGALRACHDLIGLGPGLTPSGDDIVGGVLFALHALERAYPSLLRRAPAHCDELVDAARTRTHEISAALLADFAAGEGPEPLHTLAWELLHRDSGGPARVTLTRLLAIGHRSGGDLLAGFLTGMTAITSAGQTRGL